ncbi:MAG: GIY-YIG nuclease family protein [Bacteroidota bacterium]
MVIKYLYVYIVKCNDGKYYTGVTNNIEKRIIQHNEGINNESYTYSRLFSSTRKSCILRIIYRL